MAKYKIKTLILITIAAWSSLAVISGAFPLAISATGVISDVNKPLYRQIQELPTNPNFAPNQSCLFNAYQLKCIPGEQQECPEGFGTNEDGTCFAETLINGKWEWECPGGYHSEDDDETGQCYPDTEPCYPGQIRNPDFPACSSEDYVCEEFNLTGCIIDGRMIGILPDEYCLRNPDAEKCVAIDGSCPEGFDIMNSANFTMGVCMPLSYEDAKQAKRVRQVLDQNRCPEGYWLDVDLDFDDGHGNVGRCIYNN